MFALFIAICAIFLTILVVMYIYNKVSTRSFNSFDFETLADVSVDVIDSYTYSSYSDSSDSCDWDSSDCD